MKSKKQKEEKEKTRHFKKFKQEFKKSFKTAILAAFGFLIALVWRDVITEYVNLISGSSPLRGQLISAIVVTLVAVAGIVIISELIRD